MLSFEACWAYLLYIFNFATLSPFNTDFTVQTPLRPNRPQFKQHNYPIFEPPSGPEHEKFVCKYPELTEYEFCSEHDDRGCWLRPKDKKSGLREYNIHTDYETYTPKGITRRYHLDVTNMTLYPDGCKNSECKVFNKQYPGPWIQACWGDDIEVTVTNHLDCNGTTIHWHGIRQLHNVENDGVNGVTQCPIAPNASYTYKFKASQYGTSWYHSHYVLQYADGMAGPLTIHGPSSANYDAVKDPILMTDWNQRSAFEDWAWSIEPNHGRPLMTSILLNGKGTFVPAKGDTCQHPRPVKPHTLYFQKGVRYLLRLINTSVDSTFIFSIDGHNLTVIGMDFVPIEPYTNTSVLIGIGQRYHVIVEASPISPTPDGNYWIRTVPGEDCSSFKQNFTTTTGIVRYDFFSESDPKSKQNKFDTKCSDETYSSLKPIVRWTVPEPDISDELTVALVSTNSPPYYPDGYSRWELRKGPLWLNFSAPTVLHPDEDPSTWSAELSVKTTTSSKEQWIQLVITAPPIPAGPGVFFTVAHPIHLHGHDYALLAQSEELYDPSKVKLKRDNPPRRDVALLPAGGYIVVAFKVDNPGVWLMHCHIAWHASSGLAMQIMENTDRMVLHNKTGMLETCAKWDYWMKNDRDKKCPWKPFQDDSGI